MCVQRCYLRVKEYMLCCALRSSGSAAEYIAVRNESLVAMLRQNRKPRKSVKMIEVTVSVYEDDSPLLGQFLRQYLGSTISCDMAGSESRVSLSSPASLRDMSVAHHHRTLQAQQQSS